MTFKQNITVSCLIKLTKQISIVGLKIKFFIWLYWGLVL